MQGTITVISFDKTKRRDLPLYDFSEIIDGEMRITQEGIDRAIKKSGLWQDATTRIETPTVLH